MCAIYQVGLEIVCVEHILTLFPFAAYGTEEVADTALALILALFRQTSYLAGQVVQKNLVLRGTCSSLNEWR
jgi:lactate dehydrogenase-like 2-hydroxyacid dehydrogenase